MEILFRKPEHVLTIIRNFLLVADADFCDLLMGDDQMPKLVATTLRGGQSVDSDFVDQIAPSPRAFHSEIVVESSRNQQTLCRASLVDADLPGTVDQGHMLEVGPCLCVPIIDGKNLFGVCHFERSTLRQESCKDLEIPLQ